MSQYCEYDNCCLDNDTNREVKMCFKFTDTNDACKAERFRESTRVCCITRKCEPKSDDCDGESIAYVKTINRIDDALHKCLPPNQYLTTYKQDYTDPKERYKLYPELMQVYMKKPQTTSCHCPSYKF